ncbi:rhodanese [bacterium]|nr:rhodanese [bacterium]
MRETTAPAFALRNAAVAPPARVLQLRHMADKPSVPVPLEISVEEARDLLAARPLDTALIDVREPFEHQTARIAGAEFIPMRQIPEHVDSPALPKDKHLLVHCHHGGRSLRVTEWLRAQGYPRVSNVAGGIHAWSARIDPAIPTY